MIELNDDSRGGESPIRRDEKRDEVDVDDFEGGGEVEMEGIYR